MPPGDPPALERSTPIARKRRAIVYYKIAGDPVLEAAFATALVRAERILGQQAGDKDKLYELHAPEVERVGKGKARTCYEFGCKTAIATTNEHCKGGQFFLGARSLSGNPYDDHSLAGQIDQVEQLTETSVRRAYVDRGYVIVKRHP